MKPDETRVVLRLGPKWNERYIDIGSQTHLKQSGVLGGSG